MKKPKQRRDVAVWDCMAKGSWRTLAQISKATGFPEASVSSQLRDFRKATYNRQKVHRRVKTSSPLVYEYQLETKI